MATPSSSNKKKKAAKKPTEEDRTISMTETKTKNNRENQKEVVVEKDKEKKKKRTNEIDDIFQGIKTKKLKEAAAKEEDTKVKVKKGDGKKLKGAIASKGHESAKARRRKTADGLSIYSAEELGFGNSNAGGTPLCPFDCSCCF